MANVLRCKELSFNIQEIPCKAWIFTKVGLDRVFILPESRVGMILSLSELSALREGRAGLGLRRKLIACGCLENIKRHEIRENPPRPTFLMIDVTTKCNLNCTYCLRHFPDEGDNISEDKLRDILKYIIKYCDEQRIKRVSVQPWGGEPLLALDKIFLIQDTLEAHGIQVDMSIQTNGLLLTKEIVDKLYDRDIRIGVSIDGCRTIHNMQRKGWENDDSFEKTCDGIRNLKSRYGINFGTISVITHNSIPYLEENLDVFARDLGILSVKFNPVHPNGEGFDDGALLKEEDIHKFVHRLLDKLVSLNEAGQAIFESNVRDKLINLLRGKCREICHSEGCTGGFVSVTFSRDGDIYPCELIGHQSVRIGSIEEDKSLVAMLQENTKTNPYFCLKQSEECASCPWWTYCRGGCTASCMANGWPWGHIDQTECAINRALYPRLIELILERPDMIGALTNQELRILE